MLWADIKCLVRTLKSFIWRKKFLWWLCAEETCNILWHFIFSSLCQRQCELLSSLGIRRPLTFHILIFSSETPLPNELNLGRKLLWKFLSRLHILSRSINKHGRHRQLFFLIGRFKKHFFSGTLGQMNWNLVASIYGMSSINMDDFVPIR
jgi:hypothetical protein